MRTTLEFNDDEDKLALRAFHGPDAFCALWDLDVMLRNFLKHGDERFSNAQELAEYLREEIRETLAKVEE